MISRNEVFSLLEKSARKKNISTGNNGKIIVWEWETDFPGMFAPFSESSSNYIETEHVAGKKFVYVTMSPSNIVQINLASMKIMSNLFGEYSLY